MVFGSCGRTGTINRSLEAAANPVGYPLGRSKRGRVGHAALLEPARHSQPQHLLQMDEAGRPLTTRLNIEDDVTWVAYANPAIQQQIEPLLQQALARRGL